MLHERKTFNINAQFRKMKEKNSTEHKESAYVFLCTDEETAEVETLKAFAKLAVFPLLDSYLSGYFQEAQESKGRLLSK